jgi:hypothetical protein
MGVSEIVRYTAGMRILVGTDEAGYGPQLGPLVVAATAWEVEEGARSREPGARRTNGDFGLGAADCGLKGGGVQSAIRNRKSAIGAAPVDLYRLLRGVVSRSSSDRKVAIADSKALYKPGLGLRQLERGVHAVLGAMGGERVYDQDATAADGGRAAKMAGLIGTTAKMAGLCGAVGLWSEVIARCGADPLGQHRGLAWHEGFDCALPVDAESAELVKCGAQLARGCEQAGVRPLVVRARLVFPAEFNALCERYGSKGEALSHVTIGLMREVVEEARGGSADPNRPLAEASSPVFAVCDKHGGRNFYTALLQHHFPEHWVRSVHEGRAESRYEWGGNEERVEVVFRMKGEAFLPTALASMTAKYLRELSMRAFNEFWCARVPNLRPTAGYPGDASRFRAEVTAMQRELAIEDRVMWRER